MSSQPHSMPESRNDSMAPPRLNPLCLPFAGCRSLSRKLFIEGLLEFKKVGGRRHSEHAHIVQLFLELHIELVTVVRRVREHFEDQADFCFQRF